MSLPYILGITGLMGSGKSTVSKMFIDRLGSDNVDYLELDKIFKENVFYNEIYRKSINKIFHSEVFLGSKSDGHFDVKFFLEEMNRDSNVRDLTNRLINSFMHREVMEMLEMSFSPIAIIESSTLFDSPLSLICDKIIHIIEPNDLRRCRVYARDTNRDDKLTALLFNINNNTKTPYIYHTDRFNISPSIMKNKEQIFEDFVINNSLIELISNAKQSFSELISIVNNDPQIIDIGFFLNNETNSNGVSFNDIQLYTLEELEKKHDYIQWIFPLLEPSQFHKNSPIVSQELVDVLKHDTIFKRNMHKSFDLMKFFYCNTTHWMKENDHNLLRITRIIKSLSLFGLDGLAEQFFDMISIICANNNFQIPKKTSEFWIDALNKKGQHHA